MEQTIFKNEDKGEQIELAPYKVIKSRTDNGLVLKACELHKLGYIPMGDKPEECPDGFRWFLRNTEINKVETDPLEIEIIEALDSAESFLIEAQMSLTDEKNRLLIDTDYDIVNAKRQAHEPPLPPIKTAPEKKAWVEMQILDRELELSEAKRWKRYVEAMAKKHQLPNQIPPWEVEAEKGDQEATDNVEVVKIGEEEVIDSRINGSLEDMV